VMMMMTWQHLALICRSINQSI